MDTVKLDDYLQSPCMASSLPYWKAQKTVVPDNMMIIRDDGFFKKNTVSQLSQLWELQLAYVVLLFKATRWSGELISSEEGQMEWIKYGDLSTVKTVDDFDDLLKVMNTPELTEFQYLVSGDEWTVSIR